VRESAILGILGVRTLGYYVDADFYEFKFDRALVVLLATAALSVAIDAASRGLRERLRIEALPSRLAAGVVQVRPAEA
jgi:phosphonate transport system permease protein